MTIGTPNTDKTAATTASTVTIAVPDCGQYTMKRRTSGAMQYKKSGESTYITIPADQSFNSPVGLIAAHSVVITLPSGDDTIEVVYWR